MKKIENKKGSHVGVVISFVIFVGFIIFLYVILRPVVVTQFEKQSALEYTELSLIEYFKGNLTIVTLIINDNYDLGGKPCLKFNQVGAINNLNLESQNMFALNESGEPVKLQWVAQLTQEHLLLENNGENRFFKIFASPGINNVQGGLTGCTNVNDGSEYVVGVSQNTEFILEGWIIDIIERYNTDYYSLKAEIGLPDNYEFGFDFQYNNGTIISTNRNPGFTSVYSEEINILYLDPALQEYTGKIILKIW